MEKKIPDMGAGLIASFLEESAAQSRGAVVELGSWLGAGTLALSKGAVTSNQPLYVYDRWHASAQEVEKARARGVGIAKGQNLLPLVREHVDQTGVTVFYEKGDLLNANYTGPQIDLFVDDAAKTKKLFTKALKTFAPQWQDGAILVLMDFFYFQRPSAGEEYRFQYEVIHEFSSHFEPIPLPSTNISSHAAFRYSVLDGDFMRWVDNLKIDESRFRQLKRAVKWRQMLVLEKFNDYRLDGF